MKFIFFILIGMWTAFTINVNAATSFHTRCLENLAKAIKIELPDSIGENTDNDSTWYFAGKQLRVRTNNYGDVSHIGYKLFDSRLIKDYNMQLLLDFIERYALAQDVMNEADKLEATNKEHISFLEGDASLLNRSPELPITIHEKERRGYVVEWSNGKDKVCMQIPADYQLIIGADAIELENIFERDIQRIEPSLLPDTLPRAWKNSRISSADTLIMASNGSYLTDMIRSDLHLYTLSGSMRILVDTLKPLQSLSNILLTGYFEQLIPLKLTIDKYGYTKSYLETTLQQFISYCQQEHCKFYLGKKMYTNEMLTATLFAVNHKYAYNHMLSIQFPLSILYGKGGTLKGTLYVYTPLQNVTEKFFINDIKQNE